MIRPIHPEDTFTPEARHRWEQIPKSPQKEILDNVFCGRCLGYVTIRLEKSNMYGKDLILRGKCQHYEEDVCRVVESEGE